MKKYLILAILLLPSLCWGQELARMNPYVAGAVAAAAPAASCPAEGSPDIDINGPTGSTILDDATNHVYNGALYTPGSNRTICRVCWEFEDQGATLAGKTFYTKIFTMSGDNLYQSPDNTPVVVTNGTSDGLAGSNDWNAEAWHCMEWSGSKPALTASTTYAVVLTVDTVDAQAPRWFVLTPDAADEVNDWRIWDVNGDLHSSLYTDYVPSIRIYYYD